MHRRHVQYRGALVGAVLVCAALMCARLASTFHMPPGPRPPFKYRVTSDHGAYWRPYAVIDAHYRWLIYDIELNLLFLCIRDPSRGQIVVHGTRDALILGTRFEAPHEFTGASDSLYVGFPDGDVVRLPLPSGFAKRVVSRAPDTGRVDDIFTLLTDECASYDGPEATAILDVVGKVRDELPPAPATAPTSGP